MEKLEQALSFMQISLTEFVVDHEKPLPKQYNDVLISMKKALEGLEKYKQMHERINSDTNYPTKSSSISKEKLLDDNLLLDSKSLHINTTADDNNPPIASNLHDVLINGYYVMKVRNPTSFIKSITPGKAVNVCMCCNSDLSGAYNFYLREWPLPNINTIPKSHRDVWFRAYNQWIIDLEQAEEESLKQEQEEEEERIALIVQIERERRKAKFLEDSLYDFVLPFGRNQGD